MEYKQLSCGKEETSENQKMEVHLPNFTNSSVIVHVEAVLLNVRSCVL